MEPTKTYRLPPLPEKLYTLIGVGLFAVIVGLIAAYASLTFLMLIHVIGGFAFGVKGDPSLQFFASLTDWAANWRLLVVPTLGGLLVGLITQRVFSVQSSQGPAEVIAQARGYANWLTLRSGLSSVVTSALSIATGASVGRYGPAVQLGASIGATMAQWLRLSPQQGRTLLASGAAAAIAASFNAPLAGVLFAHEVILGKFTLRAVAPVVIAAVVGTTVTRFHGGNITLFDLPHYTINHETEYFLFAAFGIVGGYTALLFMHLLSSTQAWGRRIPGPLWARTMGGGFILGLLALGFPQILGLGETTISAAIQGELSFNLLIALVLMKLIATSLSLGVGFSGGIIGPSLFIGAMLGASTGTLLYEFLPGHVSPVGVYALVGMGAVISRVIGGPITTILMVFELTYSYSLTTAVMVSVVVTSFVPSKRFGGSYFEHQLTSLGIDLSVEGRVARLRQHKLNELISTEFLSIPPTCLVDEAQALIKQHPAEDLFILDDSAQLLGRIKPLQLLDVDACLRVNEIASSIGVILHCDMPIDEALTALLETPEGYAVVVEHPQSSRMVGIVHEKALFIAYQEAIESALAKGVNE